MFENIKNAKEQIKILKELKDKLEGTDIKNPQELLKKFGVDANEMNDFFMKSQEKKVILPYSNESENENPSYAYQSDSGFDLRSTEEIWIQANDRRLIPTGLRFDIPDGYEIQVRSKSGLALNQGLFVLNSPGTVDSGYQGEIKVILFNTTNERIKINKGQKIAQAVLCPVVNGKWINLVKVTNIDKKDRNDNGFGSTGL
jgi:dUTP pyrophosphatase